VAWGLVSARALNAPREEALERLAELRRRDAHHAYGHHMMLVFLCEKWHGSHEEMFDFARSASGQAPDGSRLHALIANAHLERYFYFFHFAKDPQGGAAWFARKEVAEEIG